ncbi:hypothetical protein J3F84DRAFT_236192 [Trichoderma pleuroticola]
MNILLLCPFLFFFFHIDIFLISQCNTLMLEKATHFHYCPSIYLMKTLVCKPQLLPDQSYTFIFLVSDALRNWRR